MVIIWWIDSMHEEGWRNPAEHGASRCASIGFLVREGKETVTIAQSHCYEADAVKWAHILHIPRCSIKRMRKL